jgi:hypothetical protein
MLNMGSWLLTASRPLFKSVALRGVLGVGCLLMALGASAQPEGVVLDTLQVQHVDFQGKTQQGIIICNRAIAQDLREIFSELYRRKYPIERIRPISEYGDDDERSMQANNTSCYCYRPIEGSTKLSNHALGRAIDVNPLYNPCVRRKKDGTLLIQPATGRPYVDRSKSFKYKITTKDLCYRLFIQHGFRWGGSWRSLKDYQHFEK